MPVFDYITIIIFSLIVVICGIAFTGAGKNMKSFFAGGGAVPWWISGLALFMSFFSAGTFVVWGAIAYTFGWVAVAIQWTMCIAGFVIAFVVAPKWQKTGALTAAEFITQRLGYGTQKIYSYLFLGLSMFTTGAFLYPVAKILEVATGWSVALTTVILGILIIIYTAVGGLWAVVVTDVLQFIVLTAAVLILVPLSLEHIGGFSNFINKAPKDFFHFYNDEYSIGFLIAFAFYNFFYISGNWAYVQRYTSVKTPKDAKKVGWLFGTLYIISPVVWMLPPMIYHTINPGLSQTGAEGAYLMIAKLVLPVGMLGMVLGSIIFATSSSVNTTLNISAGVFTNDLYKNIFPNSSEKRLIRVARLSTVAFGIFTIIVALLVPYMGGIVSVVISIGAITGAALFLPPLWCLFSKSQTGRSALTVTIVSLIINLILKFVTPLFGLSLSRSMEMIVGVSISIVLLGLYEVWFAVTKPKSNSYEHYQLIMDKWKEELNEVNENKENKADNKQGKRVIGFGVLMIGMLTFIIGISTLKSGWIVLAFGIAIILLGVLMRPWKINALKTKKIIEKNK